MSATGFYIREWYASYYCNKTSQWLYGKLVADPTQIVFKENDSKEEEEAYTPLTLVIPFSKVETIKKMRSTVIFSSLVITLNNSQDIHWFSSFTDRSAVCLTLNHFLRFGLFSKDAKDQPAHKESTELGTELLKVAHDSERTLAQAAEKLESQGEQIDNCIAVMYDIEEDLDVSENLIKGLQSWFGQLTATQKTNDVVDPVVITNKDIPDVHEYEVLYYKMDEDRCPLHSLCDGILRISREALTLTTPLQAVVENYSWSEISRVYAVTPWELHISHFSLGKPDVNYTIISAHIHKFVKRLASRLKDRFEFLESSQTESLCSDLPIKGSTSTQNTSIQERSPTEYKDPMQEQKNASRQLVSDSEVEEVSSILTKIKSMALNINHEETKQNEKLDELTDSVKTATTRTLRICILHIFYRTLSVYYLRERERGRLCNAAISSRPVRSACPSLHVAAVAGCVCARVSGTIRCFPSIIDNNKKPDVAKMADKIDMSLDEIIKLNGVSKRGQGGRGNRGRGSYGRGRRYRGRGQTNTTTGTTSTDTSLKTRGRRGRVWSRRSTGRNSQSLSQQSLIPSQKTATNSTNTSQKSQPKKFSQKSSVQNRTTSRNLPFTRGRRGTRVFRGTRQDASRGGSSAVSRIQRGGSSQRSRSGAAVNRLQRGGSRGGVSSGMQRTGSSRVVAGSGIQQIQKQAIQALWKAKSTLSKINAQVMRNNIVASKRGLPPSGVNSRRLTNNTSWKSQQQVRNRRRNFASNRDFSNPSLSKRNLNNSTLSLKSKSSQLSLTTRHSNSSLSLNSQGRMKQRRPWRSTSMQDSPSKIMTISVQNPSRHPANQPVPNLRQRNSLKFNFTSGLYVPGSTGVSLNERFTSTDSCNDPAALAYGDRKVFF